MDEQVNLFGQDDYIPVEFNGDPARNELDSYIRNIIDEKLVTIPITHVEDKKYLIGIEIENLDLMRNQQGEKEAVVINAGQEIVGLEDYIVENHDFFEKAIIRHMHVYNESLEWVIEHLTKGKKVKTDVIQEHNADKLHNTKWVQI